MTPVTAALLRAHALPVPEEGDKDARGRVLIVGGCREVPGAALLAAHGALRAGAGKLQLATVGSVAVQLAVLMPEALVMGLEETEDGCIAPSSADRLGQALERTDALLLGPGMGAEPETEALVERLLANLGSPAVLDAGALGCLPKLAPKLGQHGGKLVLTPHAGEMARLLDEKLEAILGDPVAAARHAAARLQSVVVMKGARTHIISPEGEAWLFAGGTVGLATSGSGDTLAGLITGLLARGAPPLWAAIWGVYLHGEAGRRLFERYGGIGFLAREIPGEVPAIMAELASTAD